MRGSDRITTRAQKGQWLMDFVSKDVWVLLGILSVTFFVGSLIIIPILLVRLPSNFFDEESPRDSRSTRHPVARWTVSILKNLTGAVFLLAGVAMLILPGQGILTILIGISLMDFPGKRKLQRRLIGHPAVLPAINKIRLQFGREPLVVKDGSVQ